MNCIEIGSFLELDLKNTGEFFENDNINTARLNSGRSGILHALHLMNCASVYIPYYLCPDVKYFLQTKSISIKFYNISTDFEPLISKNEEGSAILIVNYFGLFSKQKLESITKRYNNVIVDNCGAFFMQSISGCYNVYSCRKFFGVPDGCYVVGPNAGSKTFDYPQDQSSDTSAFLLMRIEKGCSKSYLERIKNEERINNSDVLKMSELTKALLSSIDYEIIKKKRKNNYKYLCSIYRPFNLIDPSQYNDDNSIPMFYPLVVKDALLVEKFKEAGIYTGHRWVSVLNEVDNASFEAYLSKYMVPMPIDQRYDKTELDYCFRVFNNV